MEDQILWFISIFNLLMILIWKHVFCEKTMLGVAATTLDGIVRYVLVICGFTWCLCALATPIFIVGALSDTSAETNYHTSHALAALFVGSSFWTICKFFYQLGFDASESKAAKAAADASQAAFEKSITEEIIEEWNRSGK